MHLVNKELEEHKYKIYKSSTIIDHNDRIVEAMAEIRENIVEYLGGDVVTTTWNHMHYNIWTHSMAVEPELSFSMWEELIQIIKENSPKEAKYGWIQSWLNYDSYESVEDNLTPHRHNAPIHGYISISPQNTKTVFDNWEIVNEIGNIYIGLGKWMHCVKNTDKYTGPRITIGFDVCFGDTTPEEGYGPVHEAKYQSFPWHPHWIPIILD
jgi:hypothetical protein